MNCIDVPKAVNDYAFHLHLVSVLIINSCRRAL